MFEERKLIKSAEIGQQVLRSDCFVFMILWYFDVL